MTFFKELWANQEFRFITESALRLILAAVLSGIIGFEREHSHRPAGFRTHILVSVGSALIMITSIYVAGMYEGKMNVDVTRMSGQVISGIGFLGAGTILREGFSVKGLTTAASLWAVSCVGIAVGSGFYAGAIIATIVIFITLNYLKKVVLTGRDGRVIYIEAKHLASQIPEISNIIQRCGATVRSMEVLDDSEEGASRLLNKHKNTCTIKALVYPNSKDSFDMILTALREEDNILDVYED